MIPTTGTAAFLDNVYSLGGDDSTYIGTINVIQSVASS